MVGDSNVYILNVAVDMIAVGLLFNGIPNNLSNLRIELFTEQSRDVSDIGGRSVVCAVPVGLGEETEVSRRKQIFAFNANVINLGIAVRGIVAGVLGISNRLACLGQIAFVAVSSVSTGNAAVRISIRQVAFFALAFAALRNAAIRQQDKIFRLGLGLRLDRGSNRGLSGPMSRQYQIIVRHRSAGLILGTGFLIEPAIEDIVFLFDFRYNDRLLGVNRTYGVTLALDLAAVFIIGQLTRLLGRLDINLDGSVVVLCLGKIKAELIFAVCLIAGAAEIRRLQSDVIDGVIGVDFTNRNERNVKRTVVPELPVVGERVGTVSVLDVNLIGYAAVIRMVSVRVIYFISIQIIICPVGNVNLNHLRIVGANQIVEYQLVAAAEFFPTVVFLIMVFEILPVRVMITDSIDFSTVGAAVSAVLFLTLPIAEYTGMAENGGFVADDVGTDFGCQFSNGLAVFTDSILVDAQLQSY